VVCPRLCVRHDDLDLASGVARRIDQPVPDTVQGKSGQVIDAKPLHDACAVRRCCMDAKRDEEAPFPVPSS